MIRSLYFTVCLLLLCTFSISSYGQIYWENVSTKDLQWGTNDSLKVYSRDCANIEIANENKHCRTDGKWGGIRWGSYEDITMKIDWKENLPWRISFDITNLNNLPSRNNYKVYSKYFQRWERHAREVKWGFIVSYEGGHPSDTTVSYSRFYSDCYHKLGVEVRDDVYVDDDEHFCLENWRDDGYTTNRTISIEQNENGRINIYEIKDQTNKKAIFPIPNHCRITEITILAGPASRVRVSNFKIQRKSVLADMEPYVSNGDAKYENNDFIGAALEYAKAIDEGHANYEIYFRRAKAYHSAEFHNNAIDDFTKALSYKTTEEAYLYRGLSKLAKQDPSAIEDLFLGGTLGQAILREIDIPKGEDAAESKYFASGTGFFIDAKGYLVTNNHVIENAKGIDVLITMSGKTHTYQAKSVIVDKTNDLAILKIVDPDFVKLSTIPYTLGAGTKDVGTSVFAMGYPQSSLLGDEIKVTDGIVSSKTGYQGDVTTYQISAPIQPGNSGGPLFDKNGIVIGVTSAGVKELDNVGYAIKISYVKNLIEASPETIVLPTVSQLQGMVFTDKIKKISPYVVIVKVY